MIIRKSNVCSIYERYIWFWYNSDRQAQFIKYCTATAEYLNHWASMPNKNNVVFVCLLKWFA